MTGISERAFTIREAGMVNMSVGTVNQSITVHGEFFWPEWLVWTNVTLVPPGGQFGKII